MLAWSWRPVAVAVVGGSPMLSSTFAGLGLVGGHWVVTLSVWLRAHSTGGTGGERWYLTASPDRTSGWVR